MQGFQVVADGGWPADESRNGLISPDWLSQRL